MADVGVCLQEKLSQLTARVSTKNQNRFYGNYYSKNSVAF